MILAILEINPSDDSSSNIVKVWINTNDIEAAQTMALNTLKQKDIDVISIVEIIETDKNDYFPPCTSLDTFMRAELEGIAVLYS